MQERSCDTLLFEVLPQPAVILMLICVVDEIEVVIIEETENIE